MGVVMDRAAILEQVNASYAALRADPEAWQEYQAELAAWDVTLADGLDDDPMAGFRYAVRVGTDDNDRTRIDLWASEAPRETPDGYVVCSYDAWRRAWREKTGLLCAAIAARAGQDKQTRNG
jgi:hypothetical protein